jgi:ABC-type multidrug transport system fused ATPase/permease subunit
MSRASSSEKLLAGHGGVSLTHALAALGSGSAQDRLGFRLVLQIFWRTLPFIATVRAHLVYFVLGVVAGAIAAGVIALPLFDALWNGILFGRPISARTASIFDVAIADFAAGADNAALAAAREALRTRWIVAVALLSLVAAPIAAGLYYYMVWILQRINQVLRVRMLEHFQALSLRVHADSRVGDSIYRVYQDSAMVTNVIQTLFLQPLIYGIALLIGALYLALFAPLFALAVLAVLVPSMALGLWLSSRMRRSFRASREANSDLTSRIQETLEGIRVIKAYGAEPAEQRRFEAESELAFRKAFGARILYSAFGILMFWTAAGGLLFVAIEAALRTIANEATFAGVALRAFGYGAFSVAAYQAVIGYAGRGTAAIEGLFSLWAKMQDVAIGLDRVFELLDVTPEVRDVPDPIELCGVREGIVARNVSFGYTRGTPVLRDVSFAARVGTVTAIVGPTGSGKTTLMSLLLRLYDPDEGCITIDGTDVRHLRVESLRANVAVALQENLLFGTSVRENIRYGDPHASDDAVRDAARVACADEFVTSLPQGYDTVLGERGTKLSTGQRQRLSIARAILKQTPILILDEPTASLDAETELRVMQNLARWGEGRAIFIVTHRLSTIRHAHQVIYVRDGKVVEHGSPAALLARGGGAYAELVELESAAAAMSRASA